MNVVFRIIALGALTCLGALPARAQASKAELAPALQRTFEELAEAGFSGAVLIVRGDEVLLDAAAGLADRAHSVVNRTDTMFDIGSITKQFTATAILQLAQTKQLSIDDTLERFFKSVPADKRAITVHHLLTHTSGLPADMPVGSATTERDALVRACLAAKMQSVPGSEFVYNNLGYCLLAAIVEIASKSDYETYVAEQLFKPAGMSSSGFLRTPGVDTRRVAHGYEGKTAYGPGDQGWYSWALRGAGGVLSTTGDMMRWWRALQSDAVLSKASREKLFTPFLLDYACGWWVHKDSSLGRSIQHGGTTRGFEGEFAHYLDHDLHLIVLCNDRGRREQASGLLLHQALGRPAPRVAPLSAQEMAAFDGSYEVARGGKLVVRSDGDGLTLEPDEELFIALETGGANKKLDNDAKLAARAKKVVQLLDAGDAEAAQAVLSDKWPNWNKVMVRVWGEWAGERGKLSKVEVLGSIGASKTLVKLVHERRTVVWTLAWSDDVLSGWAVNAGLPEVARFHVRSPDTFTCLGDPGGAPREYVLAFERDGNALVQRLALTCGQLDVKATRMR